jgi:MFS family permease
MLTIAGGVLSIGMALGPMIGGLLIRTFHQVLPAFYGAIVLLLCLAVIILTLLPESLSQEQKLANRNAYAAQQQGRSVWVKVFTPLAPLSIFFPTKYDTAPGTSGQSGRDWNLTLVAVAYASAVMVLVSRGTSPDYHVGCN